MPRIRSLKPDFFLDEDLAELPLWVRVLFEGLWCHADKEGRLEDRPQKLKAVIFPYDKYDVNDGLHKLSQPKVHSPKHLPFIVRYEVNGERYLQILSWDTHQSPHHTEKDSAIPAYNGELTVTCTLNKGCVEDAHEQETINHEPSTIDHEFAQFWEAYPEKKNKIDAFKAFKVLRRTESFETIVEAFNGYMEFLKRKRIKDNFAQNPMYASSFLRSDRWREYVGERGVASLDVGAAPEKSAAERDVTRDRAARIAAVGDRIDAKHRPGIEAAQELGDVAAFETLRQTADAEYDAEVGKIMRGEA